ncbi:MAG: GNAT family N-acetyltransferase [Desulfurococcales archaeon]|nr:GNAT family N-acetyltransferase [Desulfurococcales archaeon]
MGRLIVRNAGTEDVDQVSLMVSRLKRLNEELDPHFRVVEDLEEQSKRYVEEAIESGNSIVLVAEDEDRGEVVGVVIVRLVDRVFYEPRIKALITDLYVKPSYRRKKVGALLIEKAAERAASMGAGIISAVYPANNAIAENFYQSKGFQVLQVERYKPISQ